MASTRRDDKPFANMEKIGEGTFGVVYKAQLKETGRVVAVKKIKLGKTDAGVEISAIDEIRMLQVCIEKSAVLCLLARIGTRIHGCVSPVQFTWTVARFVLRILTKTNGCRNCGMKTSSLCTRFLHRGEYVCKATFGFSISRSFFQI
jgi:serine/threonine protein kinase